MRRHGNGSEPKSIENVHTCLAIDLELQLNHMQEAFQCNLIDITQHDIAYATMAD